MNFREVLNFMDFMNFGQLFGFLLGFSLRFHRFLIDFRFFEFDTSLDSSFHFTDFMSFRINNFGFHGFLEFVSTASRKTCLDSGHPVRVA